MVAIKVNITTGSRTKTYEIAYATAQKEMLPGFCPDSILNSL
jgi:hypothetical protein